MTPQEEQLIDGLVSRVRNTPVQNKDTEAEQHIQTALAGAPDSLYVLVQTVLVQQYGLQQAQSQLNELKQQNQLLQRQLGEAQQAGKSSGGSFLSHIFGSGHDDASSPQPAQPPSSYQPVNMGSSSPSYPGGSTPPPPPYPAQGYPAQAYPSQVYPTPGGMFGGGGGGFLQGALQTAAGVAAGEMMFQGMEDLFHGFGRGGSERGFTGTGGETVVNNYYDEDRDRDQGQDRDRDGSAGDTSTDNSFYNPTDDASRQDGSDLSDSSAGFGSFDGSSGNDSMDMGGGDLGTDAGSGFDDSFGDGGDDFSSSGDNS